MLLFVHLRLDIIPVSIEAHVNVPVRQVVGRSDCIHLPHQRRIVLPAYLAQCERRILGDDNYTRAASFRAECTMFFVCLPKVKVHPSIRDGSHQPNVREWRGKRSLEMPQAIHAAIVCAAKLRRIRSRGRPTATSSPPRSCRREQNEESWSCRLTPATEFWGI